MRKSLLLLLTFMFSITMVLAQNDESADNSSKEEKDKKEKKEKSYTDFITNEAISSSGLWSVHKVDGKHFFELPEDLLDKEILVVSRISGFVKNLNFGGAGVKSKPQQVIRWQKMDDKILLRSVSYNSVASFEDPIYESVKNNNFEPIIMAFDVKFSTDSTHLFEVDPLFTADVPMISAVSEGQSKRFGLKGVDKKRSFITKMTAFPENVEIRHILTYKGGSKLPDNQITGAMSVEMNQSFILLPEEPMQPRYFDPRVSYFSVSQTNYSLNDQRTESQRFITRWRLEPKDPEAYARGELVEPIKPIVYYIDPATPEQWRPYIKQGVNDWQSAFEKIGFKNAIYAADPPSKEEDPDWSPEDVRYSVIRYVSTDIQNAMGPHVHDPRTGEIIESDIIWYHNVMRLLRNWFFIQTSAINPEARGTNFETEVMGRLIQFVAAHEVGHTLGLPHNMGSSAAYHVDSLRSPSFTKRMGTAPSIMDYARFNYVAQPEDGDVGLMPNIGPYDDWSIYFGYKYFEGKDKEDIKELLHQEILQKAGDPVYRFGRQRGIPLDPTAQTEDLGHDAMMASELGIKNLKRIVPQIQQWTFEEGDFFDQQEDLYNQVYNQFGRYMGHVIANVGGVVETYTTQDEEKATYTPVSKSDQKRALAFIDRHLFTTPKWLINEELARKFEEDGIVDRIKRLQDRGLGLLFRTDRLGRMSEQESIDPSSYSVYELFEDSRAIIMKDVESSDVYRRNLHRLYIDQLGELLDEKGNSGHISDIKAAATGTLMSIYKDLDPGRKMDSINEMHVLDLKRRIAGILNLEFED